MLSSWKNISDSHRYVSEVSTLPLRSKILDVCQACGDTWVLKVELRVRNCIDPVAVEANFIYFSEMQGKENVLCFRDMANYIISSTWHTDKMDNIQDEADRIVTTACKII